MNVPAGEDKFVTTAALPNQTGQGHRVIIFDTLVFGAVSSPTLWGRVAAWLGRSWAAICPKTTVQIYVDDPAYFGWLSRRGQQGAYTFAPMGKCCRVPDKMGKGFGWEVLHVDRSDHHFVWPRQGGEGQHSRGEGGQSASVNSGVHQETRGGLPAATLLCRQPFFHRRTYPTSQTISFYHMGSFGRGLCYEWWCRQ